MALLHRATLTPSKIELLAAYLATQPFTYDDDCDDLIALGSYRFDDPAGEVGIESHVVVGSSGKVLHMPLTYRAAPLVGAEEWLAGTMDHSVLGPRWVYNACADPVYVQELLRVMVQAQTHVEQYFETETGREYRDPSVAVIGSGAGIDLPLIEGVTPSHRANDTRIGAGGLTIVVRHVVDQPAPARPKATLTGTWADLAGPEVLAYF